MWKPHYTFSSEKLQGKLTQKQMDNAVGGSARRMMSSAAFGQIIILIVYLPILSLQGLKEKCFAQWLRQFRLPYWEH